MNDPALDKYAPSNDVVQRLGRDFIYHPPVDDQPPRYVRIRNEAGALANQLVRMCPPSRELSVALTKLDEVVFWANASIARNEERG